MKFKKAKIIFYIMTAVFLGLAAVFHLIEEYSDYSFLAGEINGNRIIMIFLICASVCLVAISIIALASKNEKNRFLQTLISVLFAGVIISSTCVLGAFSRDIKYYEFVSPDGQHTVIAEEWSYLLGGGVNFYERVNPLFVTGKESFSTDDGYKAINSNDYTVEWNENTMSFTAQNGNHIYNTVEIDLNK